MHTSMLRLTEGYRSYHEANPSLLEWIGVVGAIAFPLLYALRFTGKMPPLYDDLALRAVATLGCTLLALRRWWPERLRPYYGHLSYGVVMYCLAFLLPLTLLHNHAITSAAVNMVIGVVLIVLLTDWRNTLVMLACGYTLSSVVYWLTATDPHWPVDFLLWWFPVCGVLVAGGSIAKHLEKSAERERLRRVYGLAGSIAHEVRTPLAQVQYAIDQATVCLPPASDAAALLVQGQQAVRRGLQTVAITLQQISGKPLNAGDFVPLSAACCVSRILDSYAYDSPQARDSVRLRVDGDFRFLGDETAFELVLFNLLKNALYYLPLRPQMDVQVRVSCHPTPRIVLRDTGPGIDAALLPRLFGEFETRGKAQGTGLGLAFCRRVVNAFGGTIECRSEVGRFTEFTLTLPRLAAQEEQTDPPPADARPSGLSGRTMLVVDDEAFNRAVAKALLDDMGVNVVQAEHGEQALAMLRNGCLPDAILMDVNMPGLDGMATTRQLRALSRAAGRVPVLALTANDSPSQQASASDAGMQALLAKPIDPGALRAELVKLFGVPRAAPCGRTSASRA